MCAFGTLIAETPAQKSLDEATILPLVVFPRAQPETLAPTAIMVEPVGTPPAPNMRAPVTPRR